jgi:signal peptidase II
VGDPLEARAGGKMSERRWFGLQAGASNWLWLAVAVIALDQWTKSLVVARLAELDHYVLLPVLDIMRLHNEGAAFSFLDDAGGWQRWLFIGLGVAVSGGILFWLRRLPAKGQALLAAGLSFILGGALGNVIDRVQLGYVVDFIRVHYDPWSFDFPAFNVADSAITIGAALVILDNLLELDRNRGKAR